MLLGTSDSFYTPTLSHTDTPASQMNLHRPHWDRYPDISSVFLSLLAEFLLTIRTHSYTLLCISS